MAGAGERTRWILDRLPEGVELVLAAKKRSAAEIKEAVVAGARLVGENYLQEAERVYPDVGRDVRWHFIGRLQRNKIKKIVRLFDLVETVGDFESAAEINRRAGEIDKVMPVLIEVNVAGEEAKAGVPPSGATALARKMAGLQNLSVSGLMTMGPFVREPEEIRPFFRRIAELREEIAALEIPGVSMRKLSMGMSDTWQVAVEEGANLVRVGTFIFGPRENRD